VLALLEPVMPPFLTAHYGLSPLQIGLIFGGLLLLLGVVQLLVAPIMRWIGAPWIVGVGMVFCAGGLALLGRSDRLSSTLGSLAVIAIGASMILGPTLEMLAAVPEASKVTEDTGGIHSGHYGALYAAYNVAFAAGILIGPLLSGAAVAVMGTSQGLMWLGVVPLTLILPFVAALPRR
jgi:MFS family permease